MTKIEGLRELNVREGTIDDESYLAPTEPSLRQADS